MNDAKVQNAVGKWVPAVPLPLFVHRRCVCDCGRRFWTMEGYQGHYAYRHILGMTS